MKSFEPIFDRVLVKRDLSGLEKKVVKAGLLLPEQVKSNYQSAVGTIEKCGPDVREEISALTGKKVLVSHYSGIDVRINDEDYLLISDADVLGEVHE